MLRLEGGRGAFSTSKTVTTFIGVPRNREIRWRASYGRHGANGVGVGVREREREAGERREREREREKRLHAPSALHPPHKHPVVWGGGVIKKRGDQSAFRRGPRALRALDPTPPASTASGGAGPPSVAPRAAGGRRPGRSDLDGRGPPPGGGFCVADPPPGGVPPRPGTPSTHSCDEPGGRAAYANSTWPPLLLIANTPTYAAVWVISHPCIDSCLGSHPSVFAIVAPEIGAGRRPPLSRCSFT